jgi:hypothetical protein
LSTKPSLKVCKSDDLFQRLLVVGEQWPGLCARRGHADVLYAVSVYAICYLLVRIARPNFALPEDSRIVFEEAWVANHEGITRAFEELYGEPPVASAAGP